jgi:hypothetical protein
MGLRFFLKKKNKFVLSLNDIYQMKYEERVTENIDKYFNIKIALY